MGLILSSIYVKGNEDRLEVGLRLDPQAQGTSILESEYKRNSNKFLIFFRISFKFLKLTHFSF